MIKLVLNKKSYWFPLKQSEISYGLGLKLEEICEEFQGHTNTEAQHWLLSEMCGCSYEEAQLVADDQLALLFDNHMFWNSAVMVPHQRFVRIGRTLYEYRDLEAEMTVLEFSDLDLYGMDDNHDEMIKLLFKPVRGWKLLLMPLFKKHRNWHEINYYQFKLSIYLWYKHKTELLNTYHMNADNDGIPEDMKDEGPITLSVLERYGLYHAIMVLHSNDIKQFHWWLNRDIRELLKYMRYVQLEIMSRPKNP